MNLGQWLLALAAIALLALHTYKGSNVTVDGLTFGLLGIIALATVLPSVVQFSLKIGKEGLEASLSRVLQQVEQVTGAKDIAAEPSAALAQAATSPVASINLSRKALADALRELASAAGLADLDVGDLANIASGLQAAGHLTPAESEAVTQLASIFDKAASGSDVTTAAALTADRATQVLAGAIKQRTAEVVSSRKKAQPARSTN